MTTLDDLAPEELEAALDQRESRNRMWGALTPLIIGASIFLTNAVLGDPGSSQPAHDYFAEVHEKYVVVDFEPGRYTYEVALASDGVVCERLAVGSSSGGGCGRVGDHGFFYDGVAMHGVVTGDVATVEIGAGNNTQQVSTRPLPKQFGTRRFFVILENGVNLPLVMRAADGHVVYRTQPL